MRLILWNNCASDSEHYRRQIGQIALDGPLTSIEYLSSDTNLGGMGRFVVMKALVARGYRGPFITLDDDQDVSPTFVSDLLSGWRERTLAGWWAFKMHSSYWDRTAAESGDPISYVGTGGAICDSEILREPRFFRELPAAYAFVEDLWISRFAASLGWDLLKIDTEIDFTLSELDQGHAIPHVKTDFFEYLKGWEKRQRVTTSRRRP